MRHITQKEKNKRGCIYCADMKRGVCKHDKCPYRELDGFKTYEDYFKSKCSLFDEILKEKKTK